MPTGDQACLQREVSVQIEGRKLEKLGSGEEGVEFELWGGTFFLRFRQDGSRHVGNVC